MIKQVYCAFLDPPFFAFETFGPINSDGLTCISELGRRTFAVIDNPRETSFLFQRLSVAIQRFNAVLFRQFI